MGACIRSRLASHFLLRTPMLRSQFADHNPRLHHYVKQGLPYPDEFRYGPGRPPPPNPHLRTASRASAHVPSGKTSMILVLLEYVAECLEDRTDGVQTAPPDGMVVSQSHSVTTITNGAGSSAELDKLFAKLLPMPAAPPEPPSSVPPAGKSVHDLFAAALGGGGASHQLSSSAQQAPPVPVTAPNPPLTGHSLLNMMFASASASSTSVFNDVQPAQPLPSQPEEIVIVSPKPTSSALPHVLNQDVISSILGLTPDSRASSAAPSSVGSRRSAQHRYEGDNEYSEGDFASEGEYSKSNVRTPSARAIPTLAVPQVPSSESESDVAGKTNGSRRIAGDVTPRPPAGGMRLPPTSPPQFQQRTATPNTNGKVNGNGAAPSPAPASGSAPRARTLVPFEANSDLWPYPRAPLDDRSFEQDDVVELDFTDTRALSDPAIFSSRLKEKKDKKEKGKKGRKEREKEKEREKAEIEKGWDLPTHTQGQPAYQAAATGPVAEAATTATKPQAAKSPNQAKMTVTNGQPQPQGQNSALNGTAAKDAIIAAMSAQAKTTGQPSVGKKDFVRDLLTLIHVSFRICVRTVSQVADDGSRWTLNSLIVSGKTTSRVLHRSRLHSLPHGPSLFHRRSLLTLA